MKRLNTPILTTLTLLFLSQAQAAGTLVYGAPGEPVTLNAGNGVDSPSLQGEAQIYNRLIDFKPGAADIVPSLATAWKNNADATVWTFTLRKGVKFHDGTPFNADAVVFNLTRWWDKNHPYSLRKDGRTFEIVGDLLGGYKGDPTSVIKNVVKANDSTVRVDLTKPSSVFPDVIASGYFGIASPTAIKEQGAKYGTPAGKAVGTGPFIFQSWKSGDRVTLTANKNYWGTKAKVATVIIRAIKDPSQRLNELRAGTIDFANDMVPDSLKAIQADKNLVAVKRPSFNVGFVSLNNRNKYLKNAKVRQAISMALNKKAIVDAFWPGLGQSNASFVPPDLARFNSSKVPADYKFDPTAAKKLLADAGYPNGFSMDLWYMPVSRPYFPSPKPIAEAMAADLSAIGIKVNLKTEDWAKYLEDRNKAPGFDMYMIGWTGDYGHPDNFYSAYYGPNGSSDIGYNSVQIQSLLEKGRAAKTEAERKTIYAQIHELTYKATYRIPVVHSQPLAAARNYVKGWVPSPLGSEPFNTISLVGKK